LVADVVADLDKLQIDPPRIVVTKAGVETEVDKDALFGRQLTGVNTLATRVGRGSVPNLVEMMADLLDHVAPPIKLTRRTLAEIFRRTAIRQAALDNPQEFATQAARVIRERAVTQLVDGIEYHKTGQWYDLSQWVEEGETSSDRLVAVANSIYDRIVCQSENERRFAEKLDRRNDVRLLIKLPDWFKVATPVGNYNPDWGLVLAQPDRFGEVGDGLCLYLIAETKTTTAAAELRGTENQKIHCDERHFIHALQVAYKVATSPDDIP